MTIRLLCASTAAYEMHRRAWLAVAYMHLPHAAWTVIERVALGSFRQGADGGHLLPFSLRG